MGHGILHSSESVTVRSVHSPDNAGNTTHQSPPDRTGCDCSITRLANGNTCNSDKSRIPVELRNRSLFAEPKRTPLVPTKELSKRWVLVARPALERRLQPSPYHCQAAQHVRFSVQAIDRAGDDEDESGAHEILPIPVAHATG